MTQLYSVDCWQRTTYLVRADSPHDAKMVVKNDKERIAMVGQGIVNDSGVVVRTPTMEEISAAVPVHAAVQAPAPEPVR